MGREILMLGTATDTRGGVSSVIKTYHDAGLFSAWPVSYLPTHCDGGAFQKLSIAMKAWFSFAAWIIRRKDFVLHVHCASRASFWRKFMFMVPAFWVGRPVIFHLHGAEFMSFYRQECSAFARRLVRYILDRSAFIVVLSKSWQADIATITKNPTVRVIYNPVVPSTSHDAPRAHGSRLVFLGRLGRRKGIYDLVEAFGVVSTRHPAVRLLCGGDGEVDKLRSKVDEAGLGENIKILGWVDGSERESLLRGATAYVLPSYAEGLPMSVLEAMSAGLPIISTPVGGIPEAVSDGVEGILVNPGDVSRLADAICRLLEDNDLCERMGSNARAKFEKLFHVSAVLPQIESIYQELGVAPREAA